MSTKIYNAWALPDRTDPFLLVDTVRQALEPVQADLVRTALVTATSSYRRAQDRGSADPFGDAAEDLCFLAPETRVRNAVEGLRRYEGRNRLALEGLMQVAGRMAEDYLLVPEVDVTFSMVLLGDTGPDGTGRLYAKLFTVRDEYRDAFVAATGATSFDYWNNTDPAEGVSDAEWEQRAQVWERLLGDDAPARRGLTWGVPSTGLGLALVLSRAMPHLVDDLTERGVSPVPTGGWRGWLAGPLGGGAR